MMLWTTQKPRCNFCPQELARRKDVTLHIQNTPRCRQQWELLVLSQQKGTVSEQPDERHNMSGPVTPPEYDYDIPEDIDYEFPPRARQAEYEPVEALQSKQAQVEEVAEFGRFAEVYPGRVVDVLGVGKTNFEEIWANQINMGLEGNPWYPFNDEEKWGLGEWLTKSVNKTATDTFLKLAIVSPNDVSSPKHLVTKNTLD